MFKKLALSAAGTLALAGLASYAYVTLVPPADPPMMPTARGFFSPAKDTRETVGEPLPETPYFTKGKPPTPSLPLPDSAQSAQSAPADPSAAPAPTSEPGIAFRDPQKRPNNFGPRLQSAPVSPTIQTPAPAPKSLLPEGGKTKPAREEGRKPTTPTTPEPGTEPNVAPVVQATPLAPQPTAQANGASPSAPKRPRAKSPFTYEEELYRAQYGWQAFAEKMRSAALNPEPADVK